MNSNGTGSKRAANAPRIDVAGPTPRAWNIGLVVNGSPNARRERNIVFDATALAAYRPYVSTRKLMHAWNMVLNPAPMKQVATVGIDQ